MHSGPRAVASPRRRSSRRWWTVTLAMLLPGTAAHGVAYLPGSAEPDPPTGDAPAAVPQAAEPLRAGSGIEWKLAPWRMSGSVALDGRWLRLDNGNRSKQGVLVTDLEFTSYVWKPWFIQLRAGLGAMASVEHSSADSGSRSGSGSGSSALNGRFTLSAFPASRFPFELRADASDSQTDGNSLGGAYRTHHVAVTQSYRPETGNDNYQLNIDYSKVMPQEGGADTLWAFQATALRQYVENTFELGANLSLNRRSDTGDSSDIRTLTARHSFHPTTDFLIETLATHNDVQLRSSVPGGDLDFGSDMRQVSSFLTWRPREGEWFHAPDAPLSVTGTARWIDSGATNGGGGQRFSAFSGTVGVTKELTRAWRVTGAVSTTRLDGGSNRAVTSATGNTSVTYAPQGTELGRWRYAPTVSSNLSVTRSSDSQNRRVIGLQASHSVSRDFLVAGSESLSLTLSESAAALRESPSADSAYAISHSAGVFWQVQGDGSSQSFASVSVSDSLTWAHGPGHFSLGNLQLSRRTQLTRYTSWSANLTLQATRNQSTEIDPFTGEHRKRGGGWQQFHSGSINYESQRVFGVPRLRFTAVLSANSQQIERRSAGDIDAPRERITESLEGRLDYAIGRLDTRLSARVARIDERTVAAVYARVQRRF